MVGPELRLKQIIEHKTGTKLQDMVVCDDRVYLKKNKSYLRNALMFINRSLTNFIFVNKELCGKANMDAGDVETSIAHVISHHALNELIRNKLLKIIGLGSPGILKRT